MKFNCIGVGLKPTGGTLQAPVVNVRKSAKVTVNMENFPSSSARSRIPCDSEWDKLSL